MKSSFKNNRHKKLHQNPFQHLKFYFNPTFNRINACQIVPDCKIQNCICSNSFYEQMKSSLSQQYFILMIPDSILIQKQQEDEPDDVYFDVLDFLINYFCRYVCSLYATSLRLKIIF